MTAAKNFVFELENWSMKEFREWAALIQKENPDYERMAELACKVIIAWPFDNDPSEQETWEDINVVQWATTLSALKKVIEGLFSEGK